jgi:ATP-binding cassette subfamily F protein uup
MEARILDAEQRLEDCQRAASDPTVASDHTALTGRVAALAAAHAEVDALYARWAELEAKLTV